MSARGKHRNKKSVMKKSHIHKSSSISTVTEDSFMHNLQTGCPTSSPKKDDFVIYKSLRDCSAVLSMCIREAQERRKMMVANHQNSIQFLEHKIGMFKMSIPMHVGNSLIWDVPTHSVEESELGDMSASIFKRPSRTREKTVDIKKRKVERTTSKSTSQKRNNLPSRFQTPSTTLKARPPPSAVITPKVDLTKPLSILRRPKQGERAVSMTGSPLMVSSITHEDFPSISVPLPDGKILSILPDILGFEPDAIPHLDRQTRQQLETLKSHLQVFCERRRK